MHDGKHTVSQYMISVKLSRNLVWLSPHSLLSGKSSPSHSPVSALPSSLLFLSCTLSHPLPLSHYYLSFPPCTTSMRSIKPALFMPDLGEKVPKIGQETACPLENKPCNYKAAENWRDQRDASLRNHGAPHQFYDSKIFSHG